MLKSTFLADCILLLVTPLASGASPVEVEGVRFQRVLQIKETRLVFRG